MNSCPKCEENRGGESEVYVFGGERGLYTYSIRLAQEAIRQHPRAQVEVPEDELDRLLSQRVLCAEHLNHVDITRPGILARVGNSAVLLDGAHRGARCRRDHYSFYVYMLSQAESDDCLVGFPAPQRQRA